MNRWLVIGIKTGIPWPKEITRVEFKKYTFLLRPSTEKELPCVMLEFPEEDMDFKAGLSLCRELLSAIAWTFKSKVFEVRYYMAVHLFS